MRTLLCSLRKQCITYLLGAGPRHRFSVFTIATYALSVLKKRPLSNMLTPLAGVLPSNIHVKSNKSPIAPMPQSAKCGKDASKEGVAQNYCVFAVD